MSRVICKYGKIPSKEQIEGIRSYEMLIFFGLDFSANGIVNNKTPSFNSATILSSSTASGSLRVLENEE